MNRTRFNNFHDIQTRRIREDREEEQDRKLQTISKYVKNTIIVNTKDINKINVLCLQCGKDENKCRVVVGSCVETRKEHGK